MQHSFVAVCKNIKHYSVAKPHAGVPSPLSLLSQTAIRFCKIFKSKAIFFFVVSLLVAHITMRSKKNYQGNLRAPETINNK